jgi:hypothetical protein
LETIVGNTLDHTGTGNDFLKSTPKVQQLRERNDKWDCMKLKSFCMAKKLHQTEEAVYRMEENLCQLYIRQGTNNQII